MHGRIFEQHFQIAHKALLERGTVMALQAKLMVMHERDSLKNASESLSLVSCWAGMHKGIPGKRKALFNGRGPGAQVRLCA